MDFLEKLGQNIKKIRISKGLTQSTLAETADVSISTIARLEIGQGFTTYQTIEKIAKDLNVDLEEVFNVMTITNNAKNNETLLKEIGNTLNTSEDFKFILKVAQAYKESKEK